jgi:hypothetical protein
VRATQQLTGRPEVDPCPFRPAGDPPAGQVRGWREPYLDGGHVPRRRRRTGVAIAPHGRMTS